MKNKIVILLLIGVLFTLFTGCNQNFSLEKEQSVDQSRADIVSILPKIIKDVGVIRYLDLEGGFYGIVGKNGNYDPVNLPREFQVNGLAVQFTAEVLNVYSFHMWGTVVRLISIQTTESKKRLVMDTGVLHQKTIQGGPWIIEATTASYQVLNLPKDFMVENLKVVFVGVIRTDIIIIPALWPLVELISIEKYPGNPVIVNLSEEFKLQVGSSAFVPKAEILFTFKSVLQDSRCPIGVECFWEGEAVILVNVKIGDKDYGDYKISTLNSSNTIRVGSYVFKLNNLIPYPVYNAPTDRASYIGYFIIYPLFYDSEL